MYLNTHCVCIILVIVFKLIFEKKRKYSSVLKKTKEIWYPLLKISFHVIGSDAPCHNIGGTCQDDHLHCSGSYVTGLCSGDAHRRCCSSHTGEETTL